MRNREQTRGGLRARNRDPQGAPVPLSRARQLRTNRMRIAEQTAKPADIEHDRRVAMTVDSRRKITRDEEVPRSVWRSQAYRVRDPGSGIRDPGCGMRRPGTNCAPRIAHTGI